MTILDEFDHQTELEFSGKPRRILPPSVIPQRTFRGKKIKAPGLVAWEGPSIYNMEPLIVVANCIDRLSQNRKTGPQIQIYILIRDKSPWASILNGEDEAICGDCRLRGGEGIGRTCYVQVWPYVEMVWKTYQKGRYIPLGSLDWNPFANRSVRVGTYGDCAMVPVGVWERLLGTAQSWTNFTHHWRDCDQDLRHFTMASVDSEEEYEEAKDLGWRCFRVRLPTEKLQVGEIMCPSLHPRGGRKQVQCVDCRLCNGRRERKDRRKDVAVLPHGKGMRWFARAKTRTQQESFQHPTFHCAKVAPVDNKAIRDFLRAGKKRETTE